MLKLYAYRGKSFISKFIQFWTKGCYSHVSIEVGSIEQVPVTVEAWRGFVRLGDPRPVHRSNPPIDVYTINLPILQQELMLHFLLSQVNKRYDFLAMFDFMYSWRFMQKAGIRLLQHRDKWFCSELIAAAFNTATNTLVFSSNLVSPTELVEKLKQRGLVDVCNA